MSKSAALKMTMPTKELKGALDAIVTVSKKMPNDIQPGDARAALVERENKGWSIICAHDYCAMEVALQDVVAVRREGTNIIEAWDGTSSLTENYVIGIHDMSKLSSLITKLAASVKEIELSFDSDKKHMTVIAGSGKSYRFDLALPRKIMATYRGINVERRISKMTSEQFVWFCAALADLGKIVKPSVAKPSFGCVVMTAFPTNSEAITLSGNSDSEGYSYVFSTNILSEIDFTALLPKNLCEVLSSFLSKLGDAEGDVTVSANIGDDQKVGSIVLSSDRFSMSFVCMKDDFPFKAIDNIVKSARIPYCSYETKRDELKKSVDRLSLFADTDEAVTEVSVLDGGAVELIERRNVMSSDKPARETCSDGILGDFPESIPSLGTTVRTDVLKSVLGLLPAKSKMKLVICEATGDNARRMALLSTDEHSDITVVLLGLRSEVKRKY